MPPAGFVSRRSCHQTSRARAASGGFCQRQRKRTHRQALSAHGPSAALIQINHCRSFHVGWRGTAIFRPSRPRLPMSWSITRRRCNASRWRMRQPVGHRDAHAALGEALRLAEQAQVGCAAPARRRRRPRRRCPFLPCRRRSPPRRRARAGRCPPAGRGWRAHAVRIPRGAASQRDQAGVVRARADFREPDLSPLTNSSTPKMPRPPRLAGDGAGDVARLLQGGRRHRLRLPGFDVVAGDLHVADRVAEKVSTAPMRRRRAR
jgi:hypothetical protein